ncbi:MAG: Bifunctional protein GlmU [Parcubacteria group bacterium GW2011_GWB2_40_8]|nr:MAG: Bifunctional protein GlmU [Parcubacteria group bacterium GW2011_GWB2_40_8]
MQNDRDIKIIILAAGKGKRMQSDLPKVLATIKGKSMISYVLSSALEALGEKPIAIVGHRAELVQSNLGNSCLYILQKEQLGTGHAVSCAEKNCNKSENIIVLSGDQPFIKAQTIKNLIEKHLESGAKITFTTATPQDFLDWRKGFLGFGRILRENNRVTGIKEYKDATGKEKEIKEINAGCYIFNAKWLWKNLKKIKSENAQNEYYLTDLLHIASKEGEKIETVRIEPQEALGANTKEELEILENISL